MHAVTQDDTYKGFLIPKGAAVVNNVWCVILDASGQTLPLVSFPHLPHSSSASAAVTYCTRSINMDPERYPEPDRFIPERWQGQLETSRDGTVRWRTPLTNWGAGRRICPGQHVAERSILLVTALLLWGFNIEKARGRNGNEIPIDVGRFLPGIAARPSPFQASITPRSAGHARRMRDEWAEAMEALLDGHEQWINVPDEIAREF
ncbi:hypothetical protein CNMCM5878_003932 [Aspergillus fumigatiaffinis]|nr:hypothetical protein CNMCM5878_003932 [Aspergillus fumigatiaffinis]